MKENTAYLPLEIYRREYLPKLILAITLAQRGIDVVIGSKPFVINLALKSKKPGIYFEKSSKADKGMRHIDLLKKKRFKLIAQDEEAGITISDMNKFDVDRGFKNIFYFDKFFCWGQRDFSYIKNRYDFKNVVRTGSPRTLTWGEIGKKYWSKEILMLKYNHSRYVLFVSNLSIKNGILPPEKAKLIQNEFGVPIYTEQDIEVFTSNEEKLFEKFIQVIELVLQETKLNIVIVLHPTELREKWDIFFKSQSRICIVSPKSIDPYVLSCDAVIASNSTVIYQAIASGVPTYTLASLVELDKSPDLLPSTVAIKAKSTIELLALLNAQTKNPDSSLEFIKDYLIDHVGSYNSVFEIANVMEDLLNNSNDAKFSVFKFRLISLVIRMEVLIKLVKSKIGFALQKRLQKVNK